MKTVIRMTNKITQEEHCVMLDGVIIRPYPLGRRMSSEVFHKIVKWLRPRLTDSELPSLRQDLIPPTMGIELHHISKATITMGDTTFKADHSPNGNWKLS